MEKLEDLANDRKAFKDMIDDWTTKILMAVCNMSSSATTPTHDTTACFAHWTHLTLPILRWTQRHLDSFFDLAEMACEWNIDPG